MKQPRSLPHMEVQRASESSVEKKVNTLTTRVFHLALFIGIFWKLFFFSDLSFNSIALTPFNQIKNFGGLVIASYSKIWLCRLSSGLIIKSYRQFAFFQTIPEGHFKMFLLWGGWDHSCLCLGDLMQCHGSNQVQPWQTKYFKPYTMSPIQKSFFSSYFPPCRKCLHMIPEK